MPRILIIDDNPSTLNTYSTVLRLCGHATATAATGRAGIEVAEQQPFDVHLVDVLLPDMTGIDVLRELKRRRVGGSVVLITAFPTVDSSFDAAAAGAAGYIDGVLFGDEVVDVVAQALGGRLPVRHPSRQTPLDSQGVERTDRPLGDSRVRDILRAIDSNLIAPESTATLASSVGLSESGLRHLFRACTGISIGTYRRERRLQEVARRVVTTHENIAQIAHQVGITVGSLRDFRKLFRARFGMSPKTYRVKFWRGSAGE